MDFFFQLLINGLLLGGFYATMALGFSTIWGVMRLINLAHGELLILAAFSSWYLFNPQRQQGLTISPLNVDSNSGLFTFIILAALFLIVGAIVSETVLDPTRFPDDRQRRIISLGTAGGAAVVVFGVWAATGLQPFSIGFSVILLVAFAFSLGFFISHVALGMWFDQPRTPTRVGASYAIGAVATAVLYLTWQGLGYPPLDPFLSLPLIFILFFGLGYALQRGFFNRLVEGPYLTMLLVTFAVAIILQSFLLQVFAADPRKTNVTYGNAFSLFGTDLTISLPKLYTIIISVLMIVGLVVFLRYTRVGYAIRAAAQNKMAAKLMGINIKEVYAMTFAVSLALTAMAGAMMSTFQPVTPTTGPAWTLRAFAIVALGGLGKVQGVVVGGLVLGVVESYIGGYIDIGWAITAAFIMLVVMLVLRPQGITGGLVPTE